MKSGLDCITDPDCIKRRVEAVMTDMTEQTVLYDDFFSESGDRGVETIIEHRGKQLTFRMRKSITLGEKQDAMAASVSISLTKDGTPRIDRMDNAAYTEAIVLAAVKAWPFVYPKDYPDKSLAGRPVPINAETVHKLDGALSEKIAAIVQGQGDAQKAALTPFEMKSGAAS